MPVREATVRCAIAAMWAALPRGAAAPQSRNLVTNAPAAAQSAQWQRTDARAVGSGFTAHAHVQTWRQKQLRHHHDVRLGARELDAG